jgi:hypothetical protein
MSEPRQEDASQDQLSTIMKMVMELSQEVQTLKKPMEVDNSQESESETTEAEPEASWSEVIRSPKTEPHGERAVHLCRLLSGAPSLQHLKASEGDIPSYSGVPETPTARWSNKADSQLQMVQRKLEQSLNLLVLHSESDNPAAITACAAWMRSAWQDLQEQRRRMLAGRDSYKLDGRPDDVKPRLLSAEEEKKISRKPRPPWTRTTQPKESPPSWRGRSTSRGKGGKGKGGGKKTYRHKSGD